MSAEEWGTWNRMNRKGRTYFRNTELLAISKVCSDMEKEREREMEVHKALSS